MAVVWAKELARYGIRVWSIAPGFTHTEILASMRPEVLEKITAPVPFRRLGQPEEIAHAVLFIVENDLFTGRCIEVDGGLRLQRPPPCLRTERIAERAACFRRQPESRRRTFPHLE